jgi:hypothetical protein
VSDIVEYTIYTTSIIIGSTVGVKCCRILEIIILIIIIIVIIINCNWVVTRWRWLFYMYTKYEIGY